jgi:alpha-L-fucosidase 2
VEGAFLISAEKINGILDKVDIFAEKGGQLLLENPFTGKDFKSSTPFEQVGDLLIFQLEPGSYVHLK